MNRKIGILGGTFDPVHKGHLAAAAHVEQTFCLDEILLIPALIPPHKAKHADNTRVAPFAHRVAMLRLALTSHPGWEISEIEAARPEPSYTIDTLRLLRRDMGNLVRFFFIIGADAFFEIATWKEFANLPREAELVILSRLPFHQADIAAVIGRCYPGFRPDSKAGVWECRLTSGRIHLLEMAPVPVSSSAVRARVREGLAITALVPDAVADYITVHRLYAD